jgi:SiaC family regulatory phosphoprotein
MENVFIEGTDRTPQVELNFEKGILAISGRSITENPIGFYKKIEDYINEYTANPLPKTIFKVAMEYFNTSTSKCLVDIFKQLESLQSPEYQVLVEWYYEKDDEEIMDSGEDYKDIVDIPFEIKLLDKNLG